MATDLQRIGKLRVALHKFFANTLMAGYYRRFIAELEFRGDEVILELGSGTGAASRFLVEALDAGGRLICTDVSAPLQQVAQRVLRGADTVTFLLGEAKDLGVPEGTVDAVLVHFVLHDIPVERRPATVEALYRVLKIGGKLIIREPLGARHGIAPEEIRRLMVAAGLKEDGSELHRPHPWRPEVYSAIYFK